MKLVKPDQWCFDAIRKAAFDLFVHIEVNLIIGWNDIDKISKMYLTSMVNESVQANYDNK